MASERALPYLLDVLTIQSGCETSGKDLAAKLKDIKLSQAMFWVIKIFVLHIKINKQKACKDPRSHVALMSPLYPSGMRMFFTRPRVYVLHICEGLRPVSLEPAPHFRLVRLGWMSLWHFCGDVAESLPMAMVVPIVSWRVACIADCLLPASANFGCWTEGELIQISPLYK